MKFRLISQKDTARLLLAAMAVLMIAAVACSSGKNSNEPDAQSSNVDPGSSTANSNGSGDGASAGADIVDLSPVEQTAEAVFTAATGELFLEMTSPESTEMFVTQRTIEFAGRTTVDALLSVNDHILDVDENGQFAFEVDLEEGPNVIEVVASNAIGEQFDEVLLVIYEPV